MYSAMHNTDPDLFSLTAPFKFFLQKGSGFSEYKLCTNSFLFSLVNPVGTGPTKMPLIGGNGEHGICCSSGYGPAFGAGHDLCIANNPNGGSGSYTMLNNSYQCPPNQKKHTFLAGTQSFRVNEYEVFGCQAASA